MISNPFVEVAMRVITYFNPIGETVPALIRIEDIERIESSIKGEDCLVRTKNGKHYFGGCSFEEFKLKIGFPIVIKDEMEVKNEKD